MNINKAFKDFVEEKSLKSGERTIRHYNDAKKHFLKAVKSKQIDKLNSRDMVNFVKQMKADGLSEASQNSYARQINTFLNFCVRKGWLKKNPFTKDIFPAEPAKEIITFTDVQVDAIFEAAGKLKKKNLYIALRLLSLTGFRISAIISVKMTDIDWTKRIVKLYNSKTRTYNEFPLYKELEDFMKAEVPQNGFDGYLFPYRHRGGIHKVFYNLRHKLGMKDPNTYNLHTFRKTFVTKLLEKGLPIFDVSKLAHHKNIKTTMKYYATVETSKLREKLDSLNSNNKPTQKDAA